jgi:hypothetical protein
VESERVELTAVFRRDIKTPQDQTLPLFLPTQVAKLLDSDVTLVQAASIPATTQVSIQFKRFQCN